MAELIDEVLVELESARISMGKQSDKITEIMDKSNGILLHIESKIATHFEDPAQKTFNMKSESELALVKIFVHFQHLMRQPEDKNLHKYSALDGTSALRQRVEYLSSVARKFIVLHETIVQLSEHLEEQLQNALMQELSDNEDNDME